MRPEGNERYDAAVEAVRQETEAGLPSAELQAVFDRVRRGRREHLSPPPARTRWPLAFAVTVLAGLIAFFVWPKANDENEVVLRTAPSVHFVVRSGELTVDEALVSQGMQRDIAKPARARLERGEVVFAVAPGGSEPFRVQVGIDEVVVYGARFSVFAEEAQLVRLNVTEGAVEMTVDGETRKLEAGQSFARPRAAQPVEVVAPLTTKPRESSRRPPIPAKATGPTRDLWEDAMSNLRGARCEALRAQVGELVRQSQFAEDKAQARLLSAECAVRVSDKTAAVALYQAVASEYPWTASAEAALFEVVTLQSALGNDREALVSAEAYQQRYPQGRFADATHFRRCELLLRAARAAEARECMATYRRDFPNGVKANAAAEYLRRFSEEQR